MELIIFDDAMIITNDLRVFQTVAETGSMSRAAAALHCVQSNVTSRIQSLEAQLGTPLFYRKARGLSLAPGGRVLLDYAETVLRLLSEAEKAVTSSAGANSTEARGSLAIGAMETTAAVRLPSALAAFHARHPAVEIALTTGPTQPLVEQVLAYELDGAFVGGAVEHPALTQSAIFEEELVLVTEPGCAGPEEIGRRVLLVFREGCSYRARAETWAREAGLLPLRRMEFGTLDAILGCVGAGMGVTLLPRAVVERPAYGTALRCHALPDRLGRITTHFVRRRDTLVTTAMTRFLEIVEEA